MRTEAHRNWLPFATRSVLRCFNCDHIALATRCLTSSAARHDMKWFSCLSFQVKPWDHCFFMLRCFDGTVHSFKVPSKMDSVATRKVRWASASTMLQHLRLIVWLISPSVLYVSMSKCYGSFLPFRNGWMLSRHIPPTALVTAPKNRWSMMMMVMWQWATWHKQFR